VKSRDDSWSPPSIAPGPISPNTVESSPPEIDVLSPPSESEWSEQLLFDTGPNSWSQDLDLDNGSLTFLTCSQDTMRLQESQIFNPCQDFPNVEQLSLDHSPDNHDMLDFFPSFSLSDYHITLPNSLTLRINEHEALRHYQTTYSLYRTTKDPNWSTHKVLLHMGSQDAMIMHLLLAVSLNDYSLRSGQNDSSQEAENHFQTGAQLLIGSTNTRTGTNTVTMMAAYFFIYLYMSKRRSTAPERLNQLSSTVLDYVKNQDLVSSCLSPSPRLGQSQAQSMASSHDRSLLARLIMWTLDEDVKCSFQGSGGHFARYLAVRDAKTKEIYDASRNALGDHWGTEYPHSQVLDDDQNSTVLEFLWAMMPLWQDINDLSGVPTSSDMNIRIEEKFRLLKTVCGSMHTVKPS
jgi:hypothetical protein